MAEQFTCTYCGNELGSMDDHDPGETLHCEDCGVDFDLVREDEVHDLAIFPCPYCGHENKRSQGVSQIRCEDTDCDLLYDPAGVDVLPVQDSDLRTKMRPVGSD